MAQRYNGVHSVREVCRGLVQFMQFNFLKSKRIKICHDLYLKCSPKLTLMAWLPADGHLEKIGSWRLSLHPMDWSTNEIMISWHYWEARHNWKEWIRGARSWGLCLGSISFLSGYLLPYLMLAAMEPANHIRLKLLQLWTKHTFLPLSCFS